MERQIFEQYADPLDSSSWRGSPPYTEEIYKIVVDGKITGYRWAYVKRSGSGVKSKKIYSTIEDAVTAYYIWKNNL